MMQFSGAGPLPIDRQHIEAWLQRADARYELPRLIRRLIRETTPGLAHLDMPAGTGVDMPDWDGTVRSSEGTAWVPEGLSLWELSATSVPSRKARADYEKRDRTHDGSPAATTAYVGFYPHRDWSRNARIAWAANRRTDGRWRDVVAYGLDDLEDWLEHAPVTRAWFADQLGLRPGGYRAAQDWWRGWVSLTSPALPRGLLTAGREDYADELLRRLSGEPAVTTVRAGSAEEVAAFVVATICSDGGLLARAAVVEDTDSWRALLGWPSPLILVPLRRELVDELAFSSGHHVVVPALGTDIDLDLPRIDSRRAKEVLQGAGMDPADAEEAGCLARRSLMAARIRLAQSRELLLPGWAQSPVPRPVRAALLAGFWAHSAHGDREVLAELAGEGYETFNERLEHLDRDRCSLVMRVDRAWHLMSAVDAWEMLRSSITPDDLERFASVVRRVLGDRESSLDVGSGERSMGLVVGTALAFSSELRRGLACSLALLAVHGEGIVGPGRANGAEWASGLVRELLPPAVTPQGVEAWLSLREVLPALAEAAPDVFLDALESTLQSEAHSSVIGSLHMAVVWSLERIAWSEDCFARAVHVLAELHEGLGRENADTQALQRLVGMFFPWRPISSVPSEARLQVLDGMRARHPGCAWQLMMSMLRRDGLVMEPDRPRYRDWTREHSTTTRSDLAAFDSKMVSRLVEDVGTDAGRLLQVVEILERLASWDAESMLVAVENAVNGQGWADAERAEVSKGVHGLVRRARGRGESYSGLSESQLCRLDAVASTLESPDAVERHLWLFQEWFPRLEGSSIQDDFELHEARVSEARRDAVADVYASAGLRGVLRLASEPSVEQRDCRHFVSRALADALSATPNADVRLLELVAEDRPCHERDLAFEYFAKRFRMEDWNWLDRWLSRKDLTDYQRARMLGATRDYPRAWRTAESISDAVASIYWEHFVPNSLGQEFTHVEFVAERLLDAGRPLAAMTLLMTWASEDGVHGTERCAVLAARAVGELEESSEEVVLGAHLEHGLRSLFGLMDRHRVSVGPDTIAALQWKYLPALGFEPKATSLHRRMADDPQFFVELVCTVYRPMNQAGHDAAASMDPPDDQTRRRVHNAHRLLKSWQHPPGLNDDGSINLTALRSWIVEARRLLRDADRAEVGEQHIGQVLWSAPEGSDGIKPGPAVRDLLEELRSEHIEKGLRLAIITSRGATCRSPDAGGEQERQLAADFGHQADRLKYQWPRTADVLRGVERSYESYARWEDEDAERVRTGIER